LNADAPVRWVHQDKFFKPTLGYSARAARFSSIIVAFRTIDNSSGEPCNWLCGAGETPRIALLLHRSSIAAHTAPPLVPLKLCLAECRRCIDSWNCHWYQLLQTCARSSHWRAIRSGSDSLCCCWLWPNDEILGRWPLRMRCDRFAQHGQMCYAAKHSGKLFNSFLCAENEKHASTTG
jgi:hypothetical protein